jgi:hypothetical protein
MGRTANEISGLRKAGDHPARGAIPSAGSAGAGADRNPRDPRFIDGAIFLAVRFTDAERYFVSSALPTTSKPSAFRHVRLAARGITRSVHRAHTVPAALITR